jgi:type II secretory pathway pseudopilin PulG
MALRQTQSGFGYLGMLFFVAITATSLAALGQKWSVAAQREREKELEFRGSEIARAIASYVAATPAGQGPQYPRSFDDLLSDGRQLVVRRHLRRLYVDPYTLQADWVLMPATGQPDAFAGVHSRAQQALLRKVVQDGVTIEVVSAWTFWGQSAYFGTP